MTTTPSKLGADMTDDEIREHFESHAIYALEGYKMYWPEAFSFARAILARQPAAIDKQEAVTREEIERARDRILEQSKNSLFRSGVKICAAEILSPTEPCDKPPAGWTCSRINGHEGPCAASPAAIDKDMDERGARVAAFKGWFKTSGIWNNAITQRAWLAACDWMQARAASTSANVAQDELQVRGRMRLKVEKLAGSLTKAEETKNDIIGDDGEQVTGVRIGWGAWALLRASIIDLIEYKCDSDSALAAAYSANVAQGAEAVGLVLTNDKGEKYGALLDSNIEERTKLYAAPPAQTAITDDAPLVELFDVLMRQNIVTSEESYLSLKCIGVPPTEVEFVAAVQRALTAAQSASASEEK